MNHPSMASAFHTRHTIIYGTKFGVLQRSSILYQIQCGMWRQCLYIVMHFSEYGYLRRRISQVLRKPMEWGNNNVFFSIITFLSKTSHWWKLGKWLPFSIITTTTAAVNRKVQHKQNFSSQRLGLGLTGESKVETFQITALYPHSTLYPRYKN